MYTKAVKRGVKVVAGIAEMLPFEDNLYDYALMVTTICFLDNAQESITEAHRVIKPGGILIIAMVDKNSPLGKLYQKHKHASVFYRAAEFFRYSVTNGVGYIDGFSSCRYHCLHHLGQKIQLRAGSIFRRKFNIRCFLLCVFNGINGRL